MTTGSRGQIAVRTADVDAVLAAVDADLRRFSFRRIGPTAGADPTSVRGVRGAEVREAMLATRGDWTWLVVEDLESLYAMAFTIHKATGLPVLALRLFQYGAQELKAYADRDLVIKVGTDSDREMPWLGLPISAERVPAVTQALGGGEPIGRLCRSAASGRLNAAVAQDTLGNPVAHAFRDLVQATDWQYVAWQSTKT